MGMPPVGGGGRTSSWLLLLLLLRYCAAGGWIENTGTLSNSIVSGSSGENLACPNNAWKVADGIEDFGCKAAHPGHGEQHTLAPQAHRPSPLFLLTHPHMSQTSPRA